MNFTYYGDLLGISSYYKLNTDSAYYKLNEFYTTTFELFRQMCSENSSLRVKMFSDSLLVYGDNLMKILPLLQDLYLKLINKGLFLRGAVVKNMLTFEPRLELSNFEKELPKDDTLARAVGLGNSKKGARLLIENSLVAELFQDSTEWLTQEGFILNANKVLTNKNILLRISPTPENTSYEYLYFWSEQLSNRNKIGLKELTQLMKMSSLEINIHFKETLELQKRCKEREKFYLSLSQRP